MSPRPEISFDRVAAEYDGTRGGVARAVAAARDVAEHLRPGPVLEVGVGTGIVAQALLAGAAQVSGLAGVDISAAMLGRAAARLPGRLVRASAVRLPFAAAAFESVVAVHVLHLVPDLEVTLAEAARVLRTGGRLVAVHGKPEHERDDDLVEATRGLEALGGEPPDSRDLVRLAAGATGFRCVLQRPAAPHVLEHTPAELADLVARRSWSMLWDVDEARWQEHVAPVLATLRALPDQQRPRRHVARRTLSVLERR